MATDLTSIFGSELIVSIGAYQVDRQYSGFAGADGLTSMHLGGRGSMLVVRGRLRSTNGYDTARAAVAAAFAALKALTYSEAADYSFKGETFLSIVWEKIEPIPNNRGQIYLWTSAGQVILDFIAYGRALI